MTTEQNDGVIRIGDKGIGASDEMIEQLNMALHYMVCDTNTAEQRHGLGLLIVKQIITAHSGTTVIEYSWLGGLCSNTHICYVKRADRRVIAHKFIGSAAMRLAL